MVNLFQMKDLTVLHPYEDGVKMVVQGKHYPVKDVVIQSDTEIMDGGIKFYFDRSTYKEWQDIIGNYAVKVMGGFLTVTGRSIMLDEKGNITFASNPEHGIWETLLSSESAEIVYYMCGGDTRVFRIHDSAVQTLKKFEMLNQDETVLILPDKSRWTLKERIPTFLAFKAED